MLPFFSHSKQYLLDFIDLRAPYLVLVYKYISLRVGLKLYIFHNETRPAFYEVLVFDLLKIFQILNPGPVLKRSMLYNLPAIYSIIIAIYSIMVAIYSIIVAIYGIIYSC